jgi:hypothetical protein
MKLHEPTQPVMFHQPGSGISPQALQRVDSEVMPRPSQRYD